MNEVKFWFFVVLAFVIFFGGITLASHMLENATLTHIEETK